MWTMVPSQHTLMWYARLGLAALTALVVSANQSAAAANATAREMAFLNIR